MVGFECDGLSSQLEVPLSSQPVLWDPACVNMCSKSLGKVRRPLRCHIQELNAVRLSSTQHKKHVGSEFLCAEVAALRRDSAGCPGGPQTLLLFLLLLISSRLSVSNAHFLSPRSPSLLFSLSPPFCVALLCRPLPRPLACTHTHTHTPLGRCLYTDLEE